MHIIKPFISRGGGEINRFWLLVTKSQKYQLIMTIDLYGDDIDLWKCPKPFPRKSPRGFMPKYGQKSKFL